MNFTPPVSSFVKGAFEFLIRCVKWVCGCIFWPFWQVSVWARRGAPWVLAVLLLHNIYGALRWQLYRHSAGGRGIALDLSAKPGPAIPDAVNLAAADGPFAPQFHKDNGDAINPHALDLSGINFAFPDLDKGTRMKIEEAYAREASAPPQPAANGPDAAPAAPRTADEFLRFFDRKYAAIWPAVLAAEAKPEARYPVAPAMDRLSSMPDFQFRKAAQLHCMRAMALLEMGRHEEARGEIQGTLRLVHALQNTGNVDFADYMFATAISCITVEPLWEGLVDQSWTDADLAALQEEFSVLHPESGWAAAIDQERAWENSVFDKMASLSPWQRWDGLNQNRSELPKDQNTALYWLAGLSNGLIRENQLRTNEAADAARRGITPEGVWQPDPSAAPEFDRLKEQRNEFILAKYAAVPYSRITCRTIALISRLRQASIAIAVERYRLEHNELPERLEALVPQFLAAIPLDPVNGAPIRYTRDSLESFRLLCASGNGMPGITQPRDAYSAPESGPDFVWHGLAPESSQTATASR